MANTIADKLTYLSGTKDAIKQAIIGKGVDVSDSDTFRSYADKISSIQTGGGGGTGSLVTGTKLAYSTFSTIPDEYISYLEQQTDLSYMFYNCDSFRVDLPLFDTSNARDMSYMFANCGMLQTIPAYNTRFADMTGMFSGCIQLVTVPLIWGNGVTENTFEGCTRLEEIGGLDGLKNSLDLSDSKSLTVGSVRNIIENAGNGIMTQPTLTLHQDVYSQVTEDIFTEAQSKYWTIKSK